MKSRTGMVVFVDIFIVLVFVIAARNAESTAHIIVTPNNDIGLEYGITIIKKNDRNKTWSVFSQGDWRAINEKEKWLGTEILSACNVKCRKYGVGDNDQGHYLLVGMKSHCITKKFFDECKVSGSVCRKIVFRVDRNRIEFKSGNEKYMRLCS